MAVPKRRVSRSKQGSRRSANTRLTPFQVQYCPQCGEPVRPHRVCPNCGYYQGREVIKMTTDEEK
jgi:large subunit ribosomal protein L32